MEAETGAMHVQAEEPLEAGREALRDFPAGPPRRYVQITSCDSAVPHACPLETEEVLRHILSKGP